MKKILAMAVILAILGAPLVSAGFGDGLEFDKLKQSIITGIDKSITRLNQVESQVENNPKISDTTKESIIDALNTIQSDLLAYTKLKLNKQQHWRN